MKDFPHTPQQNKDFKSIKRPRKKSNQIFLRIHTLSDVTLIPINFWDGLGEVELQKSYLKLREVE